MEEKLKAFGKLLEVMDRLRAECPWDQKQTTESLRHLTIEEMFELSDAILNKDTAEIKNELGDLLLHIVFYAKIASETNDFHIGNVIEQLIEKLIRRHPHIYGDTKVSSEEEVKANWEAIKLKEGKGNKSVLDGVPRGLPALVKAIRIQEKAKGVGFDWNNHTQVWEKVLEELEELKAEVHNGSKEGMENELGDVLFSIVNYARFLGVNPDDALERTNRKFIGRFKSMEKEILDEEKSFEKLTVAQMEVYWVKAKNRENNKA